MRYVLEQKHRKEDETKAFIFEYHGRGVQQWIKQKWRIASMLQINCAHEDSAHLLFGKHHNFDVLAAPFRATPPSSAPISPTQSHCCSTIPNLQWPQQQHPNHPPPSPAPPPNNQLHPPPAPSPNPNPAMPNPKPPTPPASATLQTAKQSTTETSTAHEPAS